MIAPYAPAANGGLVRNSRIPAEAAPTPPGFSLFAEDGEWTGEKRVKKMLQKWAEYGQLQPVRKMNKQGKRVAAVRKRDWLPEREEDWDDVAAHLKSKLGKEGASARPSIGLPFFRGSEPEPKMR